MTSTGPGGPDGLKAGQPGNGSRTDPSAGGGAGQGGSRAPLSGWVRALLVGSLVLNLLVVGAVTGMAVGHWSRGDARQGGPDPGFGPFTDALSREDRQELKRELARKGPDMRRARADMEADLAAISGILRREPFDAAALRGALDRMRSRFQSRMDVGVDLLVGRLTAMTPAQRTAFADRLDSRGRRPAESKGP